MNKTTNYHLPQWAENDPVRREDFNGAMASIDAGMYAAEKVTAVAYTPDHKPYAAGSYTGKGSNLTITLGFRPSFLIISGSEMVYPTGTASLGSRDLITAGNVLSEFVTFTDTGFTLIAGESNEYPQLVSSGRTYDYIAFR